MADLPNLETLELEVNNPPPENLFVGMDNFKTLKLRFRSPGTPTSVAKILSTPLPSLENLHIDGRYIDTGEEKSTGIILPQGAFANMPGLKDVRIEGIRDIEENSFAGLTELVALQVEAWDRSAYERDRGNGSTISPQPMLLPPKLLANLPKMRDFDPDGFRSRRTMEVANHEVACRTSIPSSSSFEGETKLKWLTVEGRLTKRISHSDGACRLGIADSTAAMEQELYAEEVLIDTSKSD